MITPDGGDSVYTYLWIGPNGFTSTDEDLDSLCLEITNLYYLILQVLFQQHLQFLNLHNYK